MGQEKTELCDWGAGKDWTLWLWGRKRLYSVIGGQEKTELCEWGQDKTELCDCGAGKDWTQKRQLKRNHRKREIDFWAVQDIWQWSSEQPVHIVHCTLYSVQYIRVPLFTQIHFYRMYYKSKHIPHMCKKKTRKRVCSNHNWNVSLEAFGQSITELSR